MDNVAHPSNHGTNALISTQSGFRDGGATRTTTPPLLLILTLILAGCAGDDSKPATLPHVAQEGEAHGTLQGIVMDEQLFHVPAVRLELVEIGRFTVSDIEGTFKFVLVPPGTYTLKASQQAFEPVEKTVQVRDGETTEVVVDVKFPPVQRPYYKTEIHEGFLGCNFNNNPCPGYDSPNDKFEFFLEFGPNLTAVVGEVTVEGDGDDANILDRYMLDAWYDDQLRRRVEGSPPYMKIYVDPGVLYNLTADPVLKFHFGTKFNTPSFPGGYPGFAFETPFTIYLTAMYMKDWGPEFSALG